jgi:hypothetical protein
MSHKRTFRIAVCAMGIALLCPALLFLISDSGHFRPAWDLRPAGQTVSLDDAKTIVAKKPRIEVATVSSSVLADRHLASLSALTFNAPQKSGADFEQLAWQLQHLSRQVEELQRTAGQGRALEVEQLQLLVSELIKRLDDAELAQKLSQMAPPAPAVVVPQRIELQYPLPPGKHELIEPKLAIYCTTNGNSYRWESTGKLDRLVVLATAEVHQQLVSIIADQWLPELRFGVSGYTLVLPEEKLPIDLATFAERLRQSGSEIAAAPKIQGADSKQAALHKMLSEDPADTQIPRRTWGEMQLTNFPMRSDEIASKLIAATGGRQQSLPKVQLVKDQSAELKIKGILGLICSDPGSNCVPVSSPSPVESTIAVKVRGAQLGGMELELAAAVTYAPGGNQPIEKVIRTSQLGHGSALAVSGFRAASGQEIVVVLAPAFEPTVPADQATRLTPRELVDYEDALVEVVPLLLNKAREELATGNLFAAWQRATAASQLMPNHPEADSLLAQVIQRLISVPQVEATPSREREDRDDGPTAIRNLPDGPVRR